jgi:hypothetical protein
VKSTRRVLGACLRRVRVLVYSQKHAARAGGEKKAASAVNERDWARRQPPADLQVDFQAALPMHVHTVLLLHLTAWLCSLTRRYSLAPSASPRPCADKQQARCWPFDPPRLKRFLRAAATTPKTPPPPNSPISAFLDHHASRGPPTDRFCFTKESLSVVLLPSFAGPVLP